MLEKLKSPKIKRPAKRIGRGLGSGKGFHTTGKGTKGQTSRSGYKRAGKMFEGGQNPLSKRVPFLKGVSNSARTRGYFVSKVVNKPIKTSLLNKFFSEGDKVDYDALIEKKIINIRTNKELDVKIVFDKAVDKKLDVIGLNTSKTARESVEKAGGKVQ